MKRIPSVHPGEVLSEWFLEPLGVSHNQLGHDLGISPRQLNDIILGKRGITADTALRFARYFGISARFWLGLQRAYDLNVAQDAAADRIGREMRPRAIA